MIGSLDRRRVTKSPRPGGNGALAPGSRATAPDPADDTSAEEIIAGARAGDERAWIALYRSLAPQVRGYFEARRVRQADDLTSEVFLEVARRIGSFQGGGPAFRTWVFTIAHSRLVDDVRRSQRRGEDAPLEQAAEVAAGDDVEGEAIAFMRREELLGMLEGLNPSQRDVLLLRVFGGLSVAEVAAVLHRTTTGVKVLHHRAVKALQQRLDPHSVTNPAAERLQD
ncbi:MAG: sigma-70 family RNA polymerase sigma factor [Actinomycetota bacterium]